MSLTRIGINALFLEPGMGGLDTYVRELVPELARIAPATEFTVLANAVGGASLSSLACAHNVRVEVHRALGLSGLRALSETTILGPIAGRRFDALFSPAMMGPLRTRAAHVVLVPDIIWMTNYDPDGGPTPTDRLWRTLVPRVARHADRVAALTAYGAMEIEQAMGIPRERIDVIGSGFGITQVRRTSDPEHARERFGLGGGPVVLALGAKKPHKNHLRLIGAMRQVVDAAPDARLVLPGASTPGEQRLRDRIVELGLEEVVLLPGFVDDEVVEDLYALASCVVFPSLNEGFGLPLLEAMARDVPVVTSNCSCLPEVAGGAAVLVDPLSEAAIADGILRVLTDRDLRADLVVAGRERSRAFTWERCAERVLASLQRAFGEVRAR